MFFKLNILHFYNITFKSCMNKNQLNIKIKRKRNVDYESLDYEL